MLSFLIALLPLCDNLVSTPPRNSPQLDTVCYSSTYGFVKPSEITQLYPNDGKLHLDIYGPLESHSPGQLFCIKDGKEMIIPFLVIYPPSQTIQRALSVIPELKLDRQETDMLFDEVVFLLEALRRMNELVGKIDKDGEFTIVHYVREKETSVSPQTNTPSIAEAMRIYLQKEGISTDTNMQLSIYDTTHECEVSDPNTTIPINKELSCFRIQLQNQQCPYYLLFSTSGYWEILPVENDLAQAMQRGTEVCAPGGDEKLSTLDLTDTEAVYLFRQVLETYKILNKTDNSN